MAGISQPGGSTSAGFDPNKNYTGPLIIVTALFFMWGFITCLNDILIPFLKNVFDLGYTQAMLVQFTFFGAYFIMSLPAGQIVSKIGYKNGIIVGLITAGIGCAMFVPAANTHVYGVFLAALFILASGITLLQVAANPYVSILGKPETSSSRLNLTQAFNSLGTTIAPEFGKIFILSGVVKLSESDLAKLSPAQLKDYHLGLAEIVKTPYLGLGAAFAILAVLIAIANLPKIETKSEDSRGSFAGALAHKHLLLGVICIFMYVGGEVAVGSFLINFLGQPQIAGLSEQAASDYVMYFWGGAMVGRFIGAAVLSKVDPGKALGFCATMVVVLLAVTIGASGKVAMYSVIAIGLFNSIMFPTIFTLAIKHLGINTSQGSSLLVMAIVGGAIIPLFMGMIADSTIGVQRAFALPMLCYLYIVFYGFVGSKSSGPAVVNTTADELSFKGEKVLD
jgi:MFS transporter, FHS family, L-fucose permease